MAADGQHQQRIAVLPKLFMGTEKFVRLRNSPPACCQMRVGAGRQLPWLFCVLCCHCCALLQPDENSYSLVINNFGGGQNAYTTREHTNYIFDVTKDHLRDVLDRFAQFFIAPPHFASATRSTSHPRCTFARGTSHSQIKETGYFEKCKTSVFAS